MSRTGYALITTILLGILGLNVAFAQSQAQMKPAPVAAKVDKQLRLICADLARAKKLTRAARTKFIHECSSNSGNDSHCTGTPCAKSQCFCESRGGTWHPGSNGVCGKCGPPS